MATTHDERVATECLVTRSMINEGDSILPWVRSERQFADGLTKLTARQGQGLVEQLRGGYIQLAFDPEVKGTKKNGLLPPQKRHDPHFNQQCNVDGCRVPIQNFRKQKTYVSHVFCRVLKTYSHDDTCTSYRILAPARADPYSPRFLHRHNKCFPRFDDLRNGTQGL